jgi:hypothetical protein
MTTSPLLILILLLAATAPSAAQQFEWAMQSYDTYNTYGGGALVDSDGNLYLCASFTDTTYFAGYRFTAKSVLQSHGARTGAFFAKVTPDGECLWATGMRSDGSVSMGGIAVDRENNCWVAGTFERTVEFTGGTILTATLNPSAYLARYDSTGNMLWAQRYGTNVNITSLRFDPQGNLIATGSIPHSSPGRLDTFDLGFGGPTYYGSFIACFDTAGTVLWARNVANSRSDLTAHNSGIDGSGNIYLCGLIRGTVDFGSNYRFTVEGLNDLYIAKLKPDGSLIWVKVISGKNNQSADHIAVEEDGTFYIIAETQEATSFGAHRITPTALNTPYCSDVVIAKFDTDGNCLWARVEGGPGNDHGRTIALDGRGRLWVTGIAGSGTTRLGQQPLDNPGRWGWGFFVAAYDTEQGELQWLHSLHGADGSVLAWPGGCYLAGSFHGETEIAGTKLKATKEGYYDLMLAKIGFGEGK